MAQETEKSEQPQASAAPAQPEGVQLTPAPAQPEVAKPQKSERPRGRRSGGRPDRGGRGGRGGPDKPPQEFEEEVLAIDRVTRVVKGGRRLRFRATVVIGNKKGRVGLGMGKSHEVMIAIQKAVAQAKKNLLTITIVNDTIPHDIQIKFKSAKILLRPASPGTGIIAGGSTRKVVELAGIKNILSKSLGASNRITNAKATILALQMLRAPKKTT